MFSNFAWSEMLVIACVAIIVVGPKDLPGMLRGLGKTIGNVKRMASDFQRQFNDALKEAELDEITDMAKNKTLGPIEDAKNAMDDFAKSMKDPLDDAIEADPKGKAGPPASSQTPAKKPAAKRKPAATKPAPKKTAAANSRSTAKKPAVKKTAPKKNCIN